MKQITFYLDFISPYAYLAFEELPQALMGLSYCVNYKPVALGVLLVLNPGNCATGTAFSGMFAQDGLAVFFKRFFIVAALLWKFGAPIRAFVETRLTLVLTGFAVLLVGGFVALKFL